MSKWSEVQWLLELSVCLSICLPTISRRVIVPLCLALLEARSGSRSGGGVGGGTAAPPRGTEQNRSTSRHVIINILLSSYEYTSDTATADDQPNVSVTELLALSVSSIYATEYAQEDDDDNNNKRQVPSIAGEDESR